MSWKSSVRADLPRVETVPGAWILLCVCALSFSAWAQDPNYLSQFSITWYFDKAVTADGAGDTYQYGTFANGDYWIVGEPNVVIERIDPASVDDGYGRHMNGSMINPVPGEVSSQGYDSWIGAYDVGLNVAWGVSEESPLRVPAGSSLISAISSTDIDTLKGASVLTVLGEAPSSGSFRPAYCEPDKTIPYNVSDMNTLVLKNLTSVEGTPDLATVEGYFERVWLDHKGWASGAKLHPKDNMLTYGRDMAIQLSAGMLMLHLDLGEQDKTVLLTRLLQIGIDFYGIVDNDPTGTMYQPQGAITVGRKWPILFAGIVFDDADMQNIGQKSGDYLYVNNYPYGDRPNDYIHFLEDGSTCYVSQWHVDVCDSEDWSWDARNEPIPYETEHIGLPEWTAKFSANPYVMNRNWATSYRYTAGRTFHGIALPVHIMELTELWNCDHFFDYTDRWMEVDRDELSGLGSEGFTRNMWDEYRDDYPPVWTDDSNGDTSTNNQYLLLRQ